MTKYWNDKKRQEKKSKEAQRKLTGQSPVKKTPREYFTSVGIAPNKLETFFAKVPSPLHCEDCGRDFAADEKMEFALECVYQTECLMHELKQTQTVKKLLG